MLFARSLTVIITTGRQELLLSEAELHREVYFASAIAVRSASLGCCGAPELNDDCAVMLLPGEMISSLHHHTSTHSNIELTLITLESWKSR